MGSSKNVYVVHCVDTEGPLYESIEATFERLSSNLGIQLQPSRETLAKIQKGELNLDGKEMTLLLDGGQKIMILSKQVVSPPIDGMMIVGKL